MIEQDLVPWMLAQTDGPVYAICQSVGNQVFFGNAPEFVEETTTRVDPPYIVVEGPVESDPVNFNEGVSIRYCCVMRLWVFALSMTDVTTTMQLLNKMANIRQTDMTNTTVQCFLRGPAYVDNRKLQRNKQEKDPNSSEDPLAEGHVDFYVWSTHKG